MYRQRQGESGLFHRGDDVPHDFRRLNRRRIRCRLSCATEGEQVVLRIPALENVDPAGINRIGGLHEIKTPNRLTSVANDVRVRGEKGCSVDWIEVQAAGDDQHKPILGNWCVFRRRS
jgi:hypothetical protein